jgi:hypothetical protein
VRSRGLGVAGFADDQPSRKARPRQALKDAKISANKGIFLFRTIRVFREKIPEGKVERVGEKALRLCGVIFAPSAIHLPSSSEKPIHLSHRWGALVG